MRVIGARRWVVAGLAACLLPTPGLFGATAVAAEPDIVDQLDSVDGLTVVAEQESAEPNHRAFVLEFQQPVDHRDPAGPAFQQRFQLLHRDTARPMVLHTTGYNMPAEVTRSEPTELLGGNQISVEQRFFEPSRPDPADWSTLDIWQAATDHHAIVTALREVYAANWISTGASKGGMASVYHRRFYPDDVDGTVAYVTPNIANNRDNSAYDDFFDSVGTPECRESLAGLQREALTRRTTLVERYERFAENNQLSFDEVFGSADRAFEMAVLDTVWGFWQHRGVADCAAIPPRTASDAEIFGYLDEVTGFASGLSYYTDEMLLWLTPYYYQSATQLGWPAPDFPWLADLRRYPGLYQANSNLPAELRAPHDPVPMRDIDHWVRQRSSEMLFVNGANDPWNAKPYQPSRHDSYRFTAPGGNHDTSIATLDRPDARAAASAIQRWAEVEPPLRVVAELTRGR
ncbi:PS-10 peptidase S37 [Tamaricihabitans halophyticus]|uniref:PS-10 peptidase S37 n=1 Tax=Tamaricihabitans halophyticus TaxID=1262583 RepID=A0A4V2SS13_9PSEU|nr:S28 family serine protease [Tamaricihabitans halophyticus]TCP45076.1 PS-10 peptidase S37 [Tamaricihabitans halophyticus]